MTFLHPWAIWIGLAAAALPVAVHFLTRPRPRRLAISTVRFVREVLQARRARHHLRNFLILGLRVLAVLFIAAAVARPLTADRPLIATDDPGDAVRVVVLGPIFACPSSSCLPPRVSGGATSS